MRERRRDAGAGETCKVIHANDSKTPLGSRVDRHENIGEGHIGIDGFRRILAHPQLRTKPFILETPVDEKGDDLRNLETLKKPMPEKPYDHNQIELKWYERWENATLYKAEENSPRRNITCWRCCPIPAARCTSGTSAIIPSAMRWRVTSGCAASTCCTRWVGTRSACRPRMPPSRNKRHPREWTLAEHRGDEAARIAASPSATTGIAKSPPASRNITAGTSGSS